MKTNFIYLLFVLPLFFSCAHSNRSAEKNIALVEKYVQAVENLDYEAMALLLDDAYLGLGPSYGDSIRKSEAVENWKFSSEYIYERIKYNKSRNAAVIIYDGENKGEWVSNWAELTIYYRWTETPVTLWTNSIYQIENGKIIKSYTFYNEADAYRQLGFGFFEM